MDEQNNHPQQPQPQSQPQQPWQQQAPQQQTWQQQQQYGAPQQPSSPSMNGNYGTNGTYGAYEQPRPMRYYVSSTDQTLRLVAFVFMLISLISTCWLVIPLAWTIPMTVTSWGIYKGTKPNGVAFGVCSLLFVSLVAGVCLLVSTKEK